MVMIAIWVSVYPHEMIQNMEHIGLQRHLKNASKAALRSATTIALTFSFGFKPLCAAVLEIAATATSGFAKARSSTVNS